MSFSKVRFLLLELHPRVLLPSHGLLLPVDEAVEEGGMGELELEEAEEAEEGVVVAEVVGMAVADLVEGVLYAARFHHRT